MLKSFPEQHRAARNDPCMFCSEAIRFARSTSAFAAGSTDKLERSSERKQAAVRGSRPAHADAAAQLEAMAADAVAALVRDMLVRDRLAAPAVAARHMIARAVAACNPPADFAAAAQDIHLFGHGAVDVCRDAPNGPGV